MNMSSNVTGFKQITYQSAGSVVMKVDSGMNISRLLSRRRKLLRKLHAKVNIVRTATPLEPISNLALHAKIAATGF